MVVVAKESNTIVADVHLKTHSASPPLRSLSTIKVSGLDSYQNLEMSSGIYFFLVTVRSELTHPFAGRCWAVFGMGFLIVP